MQYICVMIKLIPHTHTYRYMYIYIYTYITYCFQFVSFSLCCCRCKFPQYRIRPAKQSTCPTPSRRKERCHFRSCTSRCHRSKTRTHWQGCKIDMKLYRKRIITKGWARILLGKYRNILLDLFWHFKWRHLVNKEDSRSLGPVTIET